MIRYIQFLSGLGKNQVYCACRSPKLPINQFKLDQQSRQQTVLIYILYLNWIGSLRASQEWHNTMIEPIHIYRQLYLFSKLHKWQAATNKKIFLLIRGEEKIICLLRNSFSWNIKNIKTLFSSLNIMKIIWAIKNDKHHIFQ